MMLISGCLPVLLHVLVCRISFELCMCSNARRPGLVGEPRGIASWTRRSQAWRYGNGVEQGVAASWCDGLCFIFYFLKKGITQGRLWEFGGPEQEIKVGAL